jgi:hypothetical protein
MGEAAHTGVSAIALDSSGNIYIADSNNQRIRVTGATAILSASCNPSDVGYGQGTTCSASFLARSPLIFQVTPNKK